MKIIVERDQLVDAANDAARLLGKGLNIPILNNLLLDPRGGKLTISAHRGDACYSTSVPAEVQPAGPDQITVLGTALCGVVNGLPKGAQVCLQWNDEGKVVTVQSGAARYRLYALPANEFPPPLEPKAAVAFDVPAKPLVAALTATRPCIGTDRNRVYLNGIFMHPGSDEHPGLSGSADPRLVFVATDAAELARVSIPLPEGASEAAPVILPDFAIPEIIRMASDNDGDIAVEVCEYLVSFAAGNAKLVTKLIDGTYPQYSRVIPEVSSRTASVRTAELARALQRLRVVADIALDKNNTRTPRTTVELQDGALRIALANCDAGDAEESIEATIQGAPLSLMIKLRGVIDVVNAMNSDSVVIKFSDERTPVLLQPLEADGGDGLSRCYLSMPVVFDK